jgi:integrase
MHTGIRTRANRTAKRCLPHGLRKAGATIAANNGATAHQLMAIFGWDTIKEAEKYTAKADQRRLAETAMHLLEPQSKRPGG